MSHSLNDQTREQTPSSPVPLEQSLQLGESERQIGYWIQDEVHFGHPLTPLFASFQVPALTVGTHRAFATLSMPILEFRARLVDGYFYQWAVEAPDAEARGQRQRRLMAEEIIPSHPERFRRVVQEELLPLYADLERRARGLTTRDDALAALETIGAAYDLVWQRHFELVLPLMAARGALGDLLKRLTGRDDPAVLNAIFAGVLTKTLETDRELRRLAESAPPEVAQALASPQADWLARLEDTSAGRDFLTRLAAFLAEYGHRAAHSHEFVEPTWVEDPTQPLALIRTYLRQPFAFDAHVSHLLAERQAALATLRDAMPDTPERAAFERLYQQVLPFWGVDEDHHFFIDAMLPAKARPVVLKVGAVLVAADVLADAEDVCFLYRDEAEGLLRAPADRRALVAARRADWRRQQKTVPTSYFGVRPDKDDPLQVMVFGEPDRPLPIAAADGLKGQPASAGVYRGRVRVLHDPAEFGTLQPGEVLVCRTTTPPWTPLFSIAGAIVTDAGGVLSHAATVAREYRLPAVVGARIATQVLSDGQLVTVNGSTGTVTLDGA